MEQDPLVSIIIPVYKVEKFLDECVASVAAQTYANLEILLVDDGSPDNCPAMCDAWAARDPRIEALVLDSPFATMSGACPTPATPVSLRLSARTYTSPIPTTPWHPRWWRTA